MQAKLTLKLDQDIITAAKAYAARHHESLSGLVENFFRSISLKKKQPDLEISPIVSQMVGIIKTRKKIDEKKIVGDYLIEKYWGK